MGWNLCLATESDYIKANHLALLGENAEDEDYEIAERELIQLSQPFSCALFDDDRLQQWLTEDDIELLVLNNIDNPTCWRRQDPEYILSIFRKVRAGLIQNNSQMPVDHFLFFIDESGRRYRGGSTSITLPFGGIELKVPHGPIMRLDGGHKDLLHRNELRMYSVHIDPKLLAQHNCATSLQIQKHKQSIQKEVIPYATSNQRINPLVEEPIGWLPVEPTLCVLDYKIKVSSVDAQSLFGPDLDIATRYCKQLIRVGSPIYLLRE